MIWLKEKIPVLFAPRFWGIVATVVLVTLTEEGVISEVLGTALATIFGVATGVNIVDKFAKKLRGE